MRRDTKKIYFYNESGKIIDSFETRNDINIDPARVIVVDEVPKYTPKNGFYGEMVVRDGKLDYDYIRIDPDRDLSGEELAQVFSEVM